MKLESWDYTQSIIAGLLSYGVMPLVEKMELKKDHWLTMENFYSAVEMGVADGISQVMADGLSNKYQDMGNVVGTALLYPLERRLFNNDHKYTKNIVSAALIDSASIVLNEPIQNNFPMMNSGVVKNKNINNEKIVIPRSKINKAEMQHKVTVHKGNAGTILINKK